MQIPTFCFWLLHVFLLSSITFGQTPVVVGSFVNKTDRFYLDRWEEEIPDLLEVELSKSEEIVVLQRRNLSEILKEQALSMAGLLDSSAARRVGKMMGARYIITGTITESDQGVRITARISNVATGKLIAEKAEAPNREHLEKMIALLGNNLRHRLTGKPRYRQELRIGGNPTRYFAIATGASAIAAAWSDQTFRSKRDDYQNAEKLADFDPLFQSADRWNKARYALTGVASFSAVLTLYMWLKHLSPKKIYAAQNPQFLARIHYTEKDGIRIGVHLAIK